MPFTVAWGPPGALRSGRFTPIGGLAVAMTAFTAVAAGAVAAARRWDPGAGTGRRLLHLVLAAALPLILLSLGPVTFRSGATHGLTALGAASAWYSSIGEFWPLLGSGRQPLSLELLLAAIAYGLTPLLVPMAGWLLARAWRSSPGARPGLAFLAVWAGATIGIDLLRRRFEGYAVVPLAILAAWSVGEGMAVFTELNGVGEGHFPKSMMVAVALPVRSDVGELRPGTLGAENLV